MQTTQHCIFMNGSIFFKPGGLQFFQIQARGPVWFLRTGENTVVLHGTKPKKTEKPRTRGIPRPSPIEIFAFQYQFLQNEI